jgi:hypothetical protein
MARWPGWAQAYEPRLGSSAGIPDLGLLVPGTGLLLPVELKLGKIGFDGKLKISDIRPAQKVWHRRFSAAGGCALLLVGVMQRNQCTGLWVGRVNGSVRPVDLSRWVEEVLSEVG